MAEPITFEFLATGQEQLLRALDDLNKRLAAVERAEKTVGTATKQATDRQREQAVAAGQASQSMQRLGATAGSAAGALGRFSGVGGQVLQVVGASSGALGNLTGMFGSFGPVVGAAVAAVSLWVSTLNRSVERMNAAKNALGDLSRSFSSVLAEMRSASQEAANTARVLGGRGDSQQSQAMVSSLESRINGLALVSRGQGTDEQVEAFARQNSRLLMGQTDGDSVLLQGLAGREARQLGEQLRQARAALAAAQEREASTFGSYDEQGGFRAREVAIEEGPMTFLDAGRGQRGAAGMQVVEYGAGLGLTPEQSLSQFSVRGGRVVRRRQGGAGGRRPRYTGADDAGITSEGAEGLRSAFQSTGLGGPDLSGASASADPDGEARRANEDARMEAQERELDYINLRKEQEAELAEIERERIDAQLEGLREVGEMAIEIGALIIAGDKQALAEWLKSFAMKEALKGGAALAEAIGATIIAAPVAATKYAEAAKHFAVAAAAGLGGAALGGGGGGGGASDTGRPRAERPASSSGGDRGGNTYVINLNDPAVLVGTPAEVGRRLQASIRAAEQRFGSS